MPGDTFSPGTDSGPLVAGDFDNDGHIDLLTTHGGQVKVFRGLPGGDFYNFLFVGAFAEPIRGAVSVDLTNDQLPELVVAAGGGQPRVVFVHNTGADGIGDGTTDLLVAVPSVGVVRAFLSELE